MSVLLFLLRQGVAENTEFELIFPFKNHKGTTIKSFPWKSKPCVYAAEFMLYRWHYNWFAKSTCFFVHNHSMSWVCKHGVSESFNLVQRHPKEIFLSVIQTSLIGLLASESCFYCAITINIPFTSFLVIKHWPDWNLSVCALPDTFYEYRGPLALQGTQELQSIMVRCKKPRVLQCLCMGWAG